jgi:hypothetical protein
MIKSSTRQRVEDLLATFEPVVQQAFLDAIAAITSSIVLNLVVERLERHDIDGAIDALNLERAHFSPVVAAILDAYREGGASEAQAVGGMLPFDPYEPGAEREIRDHTDEFVTRSIDHAKESISDYFAVGLATGISAALLAAHVIGIATRANRVRFGGILGLTMAQRQAVAEAQSELSAGDVTSYVKRNPRDKRFDSMIRDAIEKTGKVAAGLIGRATRAYADGLLRVRAKVVGETEAGVAVSVGRNEAARQAYQRAGLDTANKMWLSRRDDRVRHTHIILDGQVVPFDGMFQSVSGAQLRYPRDPKAPADEIIGCRCFMQYPKIAPRKGGTRVYF